MRGQRKNDAQRKTVDALKAKGWREGSMFALQVPMYFDRPYVDLPNPVTVHIDRSGKVHRGYSKRW